MPASHTTYAPFVKKIEYQAMDVDEDGFITVLDAEGNTREDLKIPEAMAQPPPGADELSKKIRENLASEVDFYVIVQAACGTEQIMDIKVMTN